MGTRDPRFDAYIEKAPEFAKPILSHLRELVHAACPEVKETMKWSSPFFEYHGVMCNMAAFKQHCAFGFWKGALVLGGDAKDNDGAGSFGRIASLADLPSDEQLTHYIHRAMRVNEAGEKSPTRGKAAAAKGEAVVPEDLAAALRADEAARTGFAGLSPSQRREYVDWLTEAKTDATRKKRLATAVEWIAQGKSRHWKYAKS